MHQNSGWNVGLHSHWDHPNRSEDALSPSPSYVAEAKQCLQLQSLTISSQVELFTESQELHVLLWKGPELLLH